MTDLIHKKRDGGVLSKAEITWFITEYVAGRIPDYQVSALLMAIFFRGMNEEETVDLTLAMACSGETIDLTPIPGLKVDKHSTGGVGDKTTLIVAPIVASLGVPVAKMSGRGLGHTGGTIDKLESIPGFQTELPRERFLDQVKEIGLAVAGQTGDLAPADKLLYALRDVTATVDQLSLIASSVMSKKLASGADRIVLDVKTGSGAFMKTSEEAVSLARAMTKIAAGAGKRAVALITDMDRPLGRAVGNTLEVEEALDVLSGKGDADLRIVSFALAVEMLRIAEVEGDPELLVGEAIRSGRALGTFYKMIRAQDGDLEAVRTYQLGAAPFRRQVDAPRGGYVYRMDTEKVGLASLKLGAGRKTKDDVIDPLAGITLHRKTGDGIVVGETIATLYTSDESRFEEAEALLLEAYEIESKPPEPSPLIYARVEGDLVEEMIRYEGELV